jgi:DNA-binding response OmpR family regulator
MTMMNASDNRESIRGELAASAPIQVSRIAIADDDPDSLALLRLALGSPVTEICEATNGLELAQLLLQNDPFDLVVTDVLMPWLEGLTILRSARQADVMTPVLLITGLTRPDLQTAVDHLGNAKLLHKPFGISELRAAVHELIIGQQPS